MTEISEDDVKIRAYALWEADGRPDGNHDAHWLEAWRQLTEESQAAGGEATGEEGTETAESEAQSVAPSKLSVVTNDVIVEPAGKKRSKSA